MLRNCILSQCTPPWKSSWRLKYTTIREHFDHLTIFSFTMYKQLFSVCTPLERSCHRGLFKPVCAKIFRVCAQLASSCVMGEYVLCHDNVNSDLNLNHLEHASRALYLAIFSFTKPLGSKRFSFGALTQTTWRKPFQELVPWINKTCTFQDAR